MKLRLAKVEVETCFATKLGPTHPQTLGMPTRDISLFLEDLARDVTAPRIGKSGRDLPVAWPYSKTML